MGATHKDLPASSQQSSGLSDPPDSDDEAYGEEITVNLNPPTNHHSSNSSNGNNKMARTSGARGTRGRKTTNQRPSPPPTPPAEQSSDDEIAKEIKVSPSTNWKARVPAKRSKLPNTKKTDDDDDDDGARPPAKKVRVLSSRSKKWDPDNVTQNFKSPLVNVDLRAMLLQPAAWDCLTPEDKEEILSLFPDQTHIVNACTPNARPNFESLKNDDNFRHDAEQYTTNLSKGMHDPEWLRDAWTAHQRRAAGEFDLFYIRKLQKDWDMKIPYEYRPTHLQKGAHDKSANHESKNDDKTSDEGHAKTSESSTAMQSNQGPVSAGGSDGHSKIDLDQQNGAISDSCSEATSPTVTGPGDEAAVPGRPQSAVIDEEKVLMDATKRGINGKHEIVIENDTSDAAESIADGMKVACCDESIEAAT